MNDSVFMLDGFMDGRTVGDAINTGSLPYDRRSMDPTSVERDASLGIGDEAATTTGDMTDPGPIVVKVPGTICLRMVCDSIGGLLDTSGADTIPYG